MAKSGKKSIISNTPKYGNKQLVTSEQEKEIKKQKLSFSFSDFRQIDNFGIGSCSSKWHVGLWERLSTLGKMTPQEVLEENKGSDSLRCHPIDWNQKNIPVKRSDLTWLPEEVLANDKEFPIMQFSISISTGRIIGYFDRDSSIFHIVLLDPNHNIQPSKRNNYQIQATTKGVSQYDDLLNKLELVRKIVKDCPTEKCKLHSALDEMEGLHDNIVYIGLDKDFYADYQEILKEHSLNEIIEQGILNLD